MFCALLGQNIRWAFTGPLVLWFSSREPKAHRWAHRIPTVRSPSFIVVVSPSTISNVFSSETAWPIKAKFYMEPPWERRMKVYINSPGLLHMKNTVARICHTYVKMVEGWWPVYGTISPNLGKLTNKKNKNEIRNFMTEKHVYIQTKRCNNLTKEIWQKQLVHITVSRTGYCFVLNTFGIYVECIQMRSFHAIWAPVTSQWYDK